jgi:hypothetical protein
VNDGGAQRLRDRWWLWVAIGLVPLAVIIALAVWNGRGPGYSDGLPHLDHVLCPENASCVPAVRLDGDLVPSDCERVDPALVTDDLIAQGGGGRAYRIDGVDPTVAFAVTDSLPCSEPRRDPDPILVGRCTTALDELDHC